MNSPIADFHNHLFLPNEISQLSLGKPTEDRFGLFQQADVPSLLNSSLKILTNTIYIPEKDWYLGIKHKRPRSIQRYLHHYLIHSPLLIKNILYFLIKLTDVHFDDMFGSADYFDQYIDQYNHLISLEKSHKDLILIGTGKQLQEISNNSNQPKILINSIEGAHIISQDHRNHLNPNKEILRRLNIIKEQEYKPLYISLAHMFDNKIVGHARSIQQPLNRIFYQEKALNKGINKVGLNIIRELLNIKKPSKKNRINIDCKHLSIQARLEYYKIVKKHNQSHPKIKIPIIFSHTSYSGIETINELVQISKAEKYKQLNYGDHEGFDARSLNICLEEVDLIYKSGGLIGLILERRALGSFESLESNKKNQAFAIWHNLKSMVRGLIKYKDPDIWNIFCIGSDFNGLISTPDKYSSISQLNKLIQDLQILAEMDEEFSELSFGLSPETIIKKYAYENLYNFILKNY